MAEVVGVLQGQSDCTNSNSLNEILTKDQDSYGDKVEMTPKVRKPYTITKQRERWTEDEHKKFLEAVQLHGRAWRCIEEHIGTKTAVQIRSHAQKFVSKMAREANDNGTGKMKPIEIPPPRPKKKPTRPYPRKQVLSSTKEIPILGKLERCSSSVFSVSEQDGSPTSVLSVVGSESIDAFLSNNPNGCASPVGSALGSNNHESGIPSSKNSVEGDDKHLSLGLTPAGLTTEDEPTMELDMNYSMEHIHSKEASSEEQTGPTLKLFGRTLIVTNSCKQFSTEAADADHRSSQGMISESNCNAGMELDSGKLAEEVINGGFSMNGTWPGGYLPPYYCWPPLYGNAANSTGEARVVPLPWLPFYPNIPFTYAYSQQQPRSREDLNQSNLQNECSGTGSNTDYEGANAVESKPDECRDKKEVEFFIVQNESKTDNGRAVKCCKGFVPYRRCDLEVCVRI
ncbi:hypothetical protein KFK09_009900 [Dendrobium nobile]|uniref:Uncharacterized protein n=1 Tax=Dendrobium nobile TaxID=94219 RepID=A0A8T3BL17_DENNO|nr:hypothetical protein KFK09_009900 [Dendrobium nobile]